MKYFYCVLTEKTDYPGISRHSVVRIELTSGAESKHLVGVSHGKEERNKMIADAARQVQTMREYFDLHNTDMMDDQPEQSYRLNLWDRLVLWLAKVRP